MNIKIYGAGLKFMLCNAVKRLYNGEVIFHHSLDHGIYATIISDKIIDETEIKRLKSLMDTMVSQDIPFNKKVVSKQEAYDFFLKKGNVEKALNVLNINNVTVSLFEFEGQYNYFYSHDMPKSSSVLPLFDLYYVGPNELVLLYPIDGKLDFTFRQNIYNSFRLYDEWLNKQGLNYVSDVNKIVAEASIRDLIKRNDIMVDNEVYEIAKKVVETGKRIVLIAGPSSSGKTTTSKKMSLYLASLGCKAHAISLDDFFVNRDETPLDKDGKRDYECLESIDLKLFNKDLTELLEGKEVVIPTFNFLLGEKEYKREPLKIGNEDILVIEGLHALNPNLMTIDDTSIIYKVYISPLTPLNVDRHNYVSTTDNRLIRRIVRDYRTRGRSAEASLATWASVRNGEEKYIFPYTDTADSIVNTAYVYELGVLKVYVEPLLYNISMDSEFYYEARRILDNLKSIYPIPSEFVDEDNLLREFIGGSCFEE